MLVISKRRKNCKIITQNKTDKFLSFEPEQITQISKCTSMEYKIRNEIIINIPLNILSIVFDKNFNLDIQPYLHSNIKLLKFGLYFGLPIDNLPIYLEHLELGSNFNQKIDNLPTRLKILIIGKGFSQSINMLPETLEILSLSGNFNYPIDNLPIGLKTLRLAGCSFDYSIDLLPDTIETLELNVHYRKPINKLPKKLKLLVFDKYAKCRVNIGRIIKITNAKIIGRY